MQKTESGLFSFRQIVPVTAHRFEQVEGADDVGLNEFARAMDRTIDMALGREVDHGTRFGVGQ